MVGCSSVAPSLMLHFSVLVVMFMAHASFSNLALRFSFVDRMMYIAFYSINSNQVMSLHSLLTPSLMIDV